MIPAETERFWIDYIATERIRLRQESLGALDRFIDALLRLPPEVWHPWVRQLARRIVDEGEDIPVRMPLFRTVIFPALLADMQNSAPDAARLLAGFGQFLYKSPSCTDQLPQNRRSAFDLLQQAVQDDPKDSLAKKRLLSLMRSRFDYVLHELPAGVLYGDDGATIKECDQLLVELSDYERLAMELGGDNQDRELIADARFHIPAYRRYLLERGRHTNYESFLSRYDRT
jgi:PAS domain-containing protein